MEIAGTGCITGSEKAAMDGLSFGGLLLELALICPPWCHYMEHFIENWWSGTIPFLKHAKSVKHCCDARFTVAVMGKKSSCTIRFLKHASVVVFLWWWWGLGLILQAYYSKVEQETRVDSPSVWKTSFVCFLGCCHWTLKQNTLNFAWQPSLWFTLFHCGRLSVLLWDE